MMACAEDAAEEGEVQAGIEIGIDRHSRPGTSAGVTPKVNSVASATITGGTAIITTENGETNASKRPPRRHAATAPRETPTQSEKMIAVDHQEGGPAGRTAKHLGDGLRIVFHRQAEIEGGQPPDIVEELLPDRLLDRAEARLDRLRSPPAWRAARAGRSCRRPGSPASGGEPRSSRRWRTGRRRSRCRADEEECACASPWFSAAVCARDG